MTNPPSPNRTPENEKLQHQILEVIEVADQASRNTTGLADDKYIAHQEALIKGFKQLVLADRKAQATALLEKLPSNIDPYQFESSLGGPKVFPAKYTGFNEALDQVRSIIKEQGGLE